MRSPPKEEHTLTAFVYRSALATDPPPSLEELYVTEPVFQVEDEEPPYTKVVVVSAMQDVPCLADGGDKLHYLSILNKQVWSLGPA